MHNSPLFENNMLKKSIAQFIQSETIKNQKLFSSLVFSHMLHTTGDRPDTFSPDGNNRGGGGGGLFLQQYHFLLVVLCFWMYL